MKKTSKRKAQRVADLISIVAKTTLLIGVITLGGTIYYYWIDSPDARAHFSLKEVEYLGVERFNTEAFNTLLVKTIDRNLLSVDLGKVRSLVESETWVKRALIRRKLPDQLVIHLTEREPAAVAAIDDELFVVDSEGVILDTFGSAYQFLDQPIIKGLKNIARENAKNENAERVQAYFKVFGDLKKDGTDYTVAISEIDVSNPERIAVIPTDEPVAVYLGQSGFRERYETFLSQKELYLQLKQKYGSIEYVDVTYDNKIIFHTPNESVSG